MAESDLHKKCLEIEKDEINYTPTSLRYASDDLLSIRRKRAMNNWDIFDTQLKTIPEYTQIYTECLNALCVVQGYGESVNEEVKKRIRIAHGIPQNISNVAEREIALLKLESAMALDEEVIGYSHDLDAYLSSPRNVKGTFKPDDLRRINSISGWFDRRFDQLELTRQLYEDILPGKQKRLARTNPNYLEFRDFINAAVGRKENALIPEEVRNGI